MDIEKHKVMAKYRGTHNSNINALSVSPDGKRLVSAGEDGKFCMYLTPKFNEGDKEKLIENYNELPVHDYEYWMTIFMHGEEGNSKCIT